MRCGYILTGVAVARDVHWPRRRGSSERYGFGGAGTVGFSKIFASMAGFSS